MRKLRLFLACLLMASIGLVNAQTKTVSGTVVSAEDGQPIIGASIVVTGTTTGTTTNADGRFSFSVPESTKILVVSYLGMKKVEITAGINLVIKLENDDKTLDEVVVTALGVSREKKALGYSVQEVKGDDINNARTGNVLSSLEGKIAGVNITSSAGTAGASSFVTIRGQNSIYGNNQPMFVVDGVPIDNSMSYSGNPDDGINNLVEGVNYSNRAIDLSSDDVETISVLKGGAATALYGMKAANGVILITTKSGKSLKNKKSLSISSSIAFDNVNKMPATQSLYAQGLNGSYSTSTPYSFGPKLSDMRYDSSGNLVLATNSSATDATPTAYDNVGNFFQTGVTYNNSVSFAGSNEFSNFYASIGNVNTKGIIPNNTFDKTSFKINGETKLWSNFTVSGSANYIHSAGQRVQQGSNLSGVMLGLLRGAVSFDNSNGHGKDGYKYEDAYMYPDGTQRHYYAGYDNPLWTVNKNLFNDAVDRIIGNFGFVYKPIQDLSISYKLGDDFYTDRRVGYFAINSGSYPDGQIQNDNHFSNNINSDLLINYTRDIFTDLNASLTVGHNMYQSYYQQLYTQGDGFVIPDFYHISNTSSQIVREYTSEYRTAAIFGDLELSYKNMLYLGLTGRNEWSTSLPKTDNNFFYPSVSLGFIFTELPALKNNSILNYGKLRASYSQIANDPSPYSLTTPFVLASAGDGWTNGISFPFEGTAGFKSSNSLGNPTLKPERLLSREIGVELKLFDSRISLDVAYYNNQNKDLLLPVPISGSSGYNSIWMNAATMENKGIEIFASFIPVKTKDWQWTVSSNFTMNKNKVLSLADGVDNIELGGFTGITVNVVAGEPYGSIYSTGFVKDANGNVVINDNTSSAGYGYPIKDNTMKSLGSVSPKWIWDFTNELTYKGISLSFLIDIKYGGLMWNGTKSRLMGFGTAKFTENRGNTVIFTGVKGHVNSDGTITTNGTNDIETTYSEYYFKNIGGGSSPAQEQFVEKTDWVRLREITISCDLGKYLKTPVLSKMSLFATGRNLFLSTSYDGIDPETNLMGAQNAQGLDYFNMPNTKSILFGFKLNL